MLNGAYLRYLECTIKDSYLQMITDVEETSI